LKLGVFLATINIFKEIGAEIQEIYIETMEIQSSFGPLVKICTFMNMPLDLGDRKRINRKRRAQGREARAAAREKHSGKGVDFAVDLVEIYVKDLSFSFCSEGQVPTPVMHNVSASFAQGQMHAFVGEPHGGKSTFLKLIGQVFLPHEGSGTVFIPPHLRILHVSQPTVVVHGSFLENIILNQKLELIGGVGRVKEICEFLNFEAEVLRHLNDHEDATVWVQRLSNTAFSRLALARAFVMNPEVLVIHKPTAAFNDHEVTSISKLLRDHVDSKGLDLPTAGIRFRRPRTVFFTSATRMGVRMADTVNRVCKGQLKAIDRNNVTMQDLE